MSITRLTRFTDSARSSASGESNLWQLVNEPNFSPAASIFSFTSANLASGASHSRPCGWSKSIRNSM